MPYDPRPKSEGGNRSIDTEDGFRRNAPKGKFRIVQVDTFSGEDRHCGDVVELDRAKAFADREGGVMNKIYVYNDEGVCVYNAGTF